MSVLKRRPKEAAGRLRHRAGSTLGPLPLKPLLGPPAGWALGWRVKINLLGGVHIRMHVWVCVLFQVWYLQPGRRPRFSPLTLLFSTFIGRFWHLKADCDQVQPLSSRTTWAGSGGLHSPRPAASSNPPYLACSQIRSPEVKVALPAHWLRVEPGESWNEATVSKIQHSEAKWFMGASDGLPAGNQRTPPACGSLGGKDSGSGGKFLPL